jgi:hypothetical protein
MKRRRSIAMPKALLGRVSGASVATAGDNSTPMLRALTTVGPAAVTGMRVEVLRNYTLFIASIA